MKSIFLILFCSALFLLGQELKLTDGLWYMCIPENSGELKTLQEAFRLKEDGSAERVLEEKARQQEEDLRQKLKSAGKELPEFTYRWEWKDNQFILHSESPAQKNFRKTDVFLPLAGRNDILIPQNKKQITILAKEGAKLSQRQATLFFQQLNEATRDKFADDLKLPENTSLSEPEKELCNIHFFNNSHWRDAPEKSFQQFVLNSINRGPKLAENAQCQLPALEKLLSSADTKRILLQYLACNPEWRLYRSDKNTLHAVRYFRYPDGTIAPTLHQYYSHFLPTGEEGKKIGDAELEFQFRFEIALDGTVWNSSVLYPRNKTEHSGNAWETRFKCGDALVNIYDQTQFEGRQMTAATLGYSEKEFERLLADAKNWRDCLPKDSFQIGKPELILRNESQGGIYEAAIWCNPGEKGIIYLKAFEITKGTQLSGKRLKQSSNCISGWSDNSQEQFFSAMEFTIYEGEWDQFYGARFEIWFIPDSGKPERKLFEKNYRIQGWQR